jgi:hypothetical protein
VCDDWLGVHGFLNFLQDMGERPPGRSLDRVNVDGNYELKNCRWSLPVEQCNNKRNNRYFVYQGRRQSITLWAREFRINPMLVIGRINKGWDELRALTTPPRPINQG